jgi:hypothetical protein
MPCGSFEQFALISSGAVRRIGRFIVTPGNCHRQKGDGRRHQDANYIAFDPRDAAAGEKVRFGQRLPLAGERAGGFCLRFSLQNVYQVFASGRQFYATLLAIDESRHRFWAASCHGM